MAKSTCSIQGCEKKAKRKGWCSMHYSRWLNHGSTEPNFRSLSLAPVERFLLRIEIDSAGCWIWQGALDDSGYAVFKHDDQKRGHRWSYEHFKGPIPAGLQLDHLCRVRRCVCPDHLEAVDVRTNVRRGQGPTALHAAQTHCIRGHEFTPENTYLNRTKYGLSRTCRACRRERYRLNKSA